MVRLLTLQSVALTQPRPVLILSNFVLTPAPVIDPVVRRTACVRADRFVVRIMLAVLEEHVSLNRILSRQCINDANAVTTVPPGDVQLNDVCDYGAGYAGGARTYGALKPDSISPD